MRALKGRGAARQPAVLVVLGDREVELDHGAVERILERDLRARLEVLAAHAAAGRRGPRRRDGRRRAAAAPARPRDSSANRSERSRSSNEKPPPPSAPPIPGPVPGPCRHRRRSGAPSRAAAGIPRRDRAGRAGRRRRASPASPSVAQASATSLNLRSPSGSFETSGWYLRASLPVRLLDLGLGGVACDAEDGVVIRVLHGRSGRCLSPAPPPRAGRDSTRS